MQTTGTQVSIWDLHPLGLTSCAIYLPQALSGILSSSFPTRGSLAASGDSDSEKRQGAAEGLF